MAQALDDLAATRVSVWLDGLSRPRIVTGSLACMVDGGATNPTIFTTAIGAGSGCDLALRGTAIGETAASSFPPHSPLMQLRWN